MKLRVKLFLLMIQMSSISLVAFTVKNGETATAVQKSKGMRRKTVKPQNQKAQTEHFYDREPVKGKTPAEKEMEKNQFKKNQSSN